MFNAIYYTVNTVQSCKFQAASYFGYDFLLLTLLFGWSCVYMVVLIRAGETPVPIPNTEVKPNAVNDTGAFALGK